jgi:DNA modification methylase
MKTTVGRSVIFQGDCRQILASLPANSVHMVCTSPPYWGLRDYKIEPSIWGGDPACEHEWGDTIAVNATNHTAKARWNHTRNGRDELQPPEKRVSWLRTEVKQGQFCQKCGAWCGCLGLEPTPKLFVEHIVEVFEAVRRVLRPDGVCFMNMGDSYATGAGKVGARPGGGEQGDSWTGPATQPNRMPQDGLKPKDLVGVPWRCAFALQDAGWWLRSDIIWAKPNPMPESVTDRPTKSHEYVFLLTKSERYFWDAEAVREPSIGTSPGDLDGGPQRLADGQNANDGRNFRKVKVPGGWDRGDGAHGTIHRDGRTSAEYQEAEVRSGRNIRSVWTIATAPFAEAHFATFPPALVERCIKAGTSERGCCPACGAPWARVVEKGAPDLDHQRACGGDATGTYDGKATKDYGPARAQDPSATKARILAGMTARETTGWRPTCSCQAAEPIPCTVLDCFSGAGTTALVSDRLQRSAIGIELNPDYVTMSVNRIRGDAPLFAAAPG